MVSQRRIWTIAATALWIASADAAFAQQPDTRLIDSEPKVVIRQPGGDAPEIPGGGRIPPPPDRGSDVDRNLDLELEMKERRERRDGGSATPSWLAAAVFVAAGGFLLVLVTWALRRRDR
jgi:hypothetical protein